MSHFVVKDWAGNTMPWGEFPSFDDAWGFISEKIDERILQDGITEESEREKEHEAWAGEYFVEFIDNQ